MKFGFIEKLNQENILEEYENIIESGETMAWCCGTGQSVRYGGYCRWSCGVSAYSACPYADGRFWCATGREAMGCKMYASYYSSASTWSAACGGDVGG